MATGFFLKDVRAARTNIYIIVRIAGQRYLKPTCIMPSHELIRFQCL